MEEKRILLLGKLFKLQEIMANYAWEKDGYNSHYNYAYITEKQYKNNFKKALLESKLLWKMETIKVEYDDTTLKNQNLFIGDFIGTLTDPDTGLFESFSFTGTGADTGDKALYKAITGGLKFFLASNFNVGEEGDPENDKGSPLAPKPKRPATEPQREEIKKELINKEGLATELQIGAIRATLEAIMKLDPEQEKMVNTLTSRTENFTKLKKADAEALLIKLGDLATQIRKEKGEVVFVNNVTKENIATKVEKKLVTVKPTATKAEVDKAKVEADKPKVELKKEEKEEKKEEGEGE